MNWVGLETGSDNVLPFALRLVESNNLIYIAEDNNEYACGKVPAKCLETYGNINIMVCVSHHGEGC